MKPISIFKLTPAQISLVERLATAKTGMPMDSFDYPEMISYQELEKIGLAQIKPGRGKIRIVLTDKGNEVRERNYLSKDVVLRLTAPQIAALEFIEPGCRKLSDMPAEKIDVCRRMSLRGWAKWEEDADGINRISLTTEGHEILTLLRKGAGKA